MSLSLATRFRLDDLRRFAASMVSQVGVAPARASALATHLLWFDAIGASSHGIATLPGWLDRLDRGEIDARLEGRARLEHAGTAVFDGENGIAPLAMTKAAGIAAEKARDVGIGIVRVANLKDSRPCSVPVAADLAVGPFVAIIAGPGPSMTIAVPMPEGLPALFDSSLDDRLEPGKPAELLARWSPWLAALTGGGSDGTMILALAVPAMEPLTSFHERVGPSFRKATEGPGWLLPGTWEVRRLEARERGVSLDDAGSAGLQSWSDRLGVPWPNASSG